MDFVQSVLVLEATLTLASLATANSGYDDDVDRCNSERAHAEFPQEEATEVVDVVLVAVVAVVVVDEPGQTALLQPVSLSFPLISCVPPFLIALLESSVKPM